MAKLVIIDGSSYFFRAFFAIRQLSNSKGFPTNAIFGFINMLLKVLDTEKPTKLAIAFDAGRATFRKEMYAEYKANREAAPDDLKVQIPRILEAVDLFRIFRIQKDGFEADDLIATLAKKATEEGYAVDIISGDKDLMQLVSDNVTLYDTMNDKRYDAVAVEEKHGVKPEQMVDLLALMGDSSDNIPGVSGIGKKTAAELLQAHGSLDGIYSHLDAITKKKCRETLEQEKDMAYLSKELATLKADVDVKLGWQDLDYKGPNTEGLRSFFQEMEFQNLLKRFGLEASTKSFDRGKYLAVVDPSQLDEVLGELKRAPLVAVDTETTSLDTREAKLVGVSLAGKAGKAYYIPVGHTVAGEEADGQIPLEEVKKRLGPFLADSTIPKVGQNVKYDLEILQRAGMPLKGVVGDTMLMSYLLDPEQPHNLDSLCFRHLGHQNITYEEVTGKGKNQVSFAEVSIPKATQYAAEDAEVTIALHDCLSKMLTDAPLLKLYREVELPLLEVLAEMEMCGVAVNKAKLEKMGLALEKEIAEVQKQVYASAGGEFNIGSPKQLATILFEKLKLPTIRKTKTGFSTDERVLVQLSSSHAIAEQILRYRELMKLKSTYVEGLLASIDPETGRVHTNFNQTVAATGRLSSSNPNLQNIPTTRNVEYDIRSVFIPRKNWQLFSADYSQIELRILAHFSDDPELVKAFKNNEDVHEHTARLIFNVKDVLPEQRNVAKTINFGVVYGQTPFGLSQQLKISTTEAKIFIDNYFKRYANVQAFLEGIKEEAREKGYVTTLMGRRRYVREIDSNNRMRREMAERLAINAPLQGTAADMIKVAMISIHRAMATQKLEAKMLLQVHDELVFEAPENEKGALEKLVCQQMESAMALKVALKVESEWSDHW